MLPCLPHILKIFLFAIFNMRFLEELSYWLTEDEALQASSEIIPRILSCVCLEAAEGVVGVEEGQDETE